MTDTMIAPEPPVYLGPEPSDELEQRVQRLEDAVAALVDTDDLEDRVTQRVAETLRAEAAAKPIPMATPVAQIPLPPADANGVAGPKTARLAKDATEAVFATLRRPTLIGEIWSDFKTFFRMIRDPFYAMTWTGVIVPLVALAYILNPLKFWPINVIPDSIMFVGLLDEIVVAFFGLKVFDRELRRYRDFLAARAR
jgi:uncharacterized membrane protein YkvA (DUF1232 family)